MAVGFSNTNKPINPRGQDASPLAFNRAKLYSGKALSFDGVNDNIVASSFSGLSGEAKASISLYFNFDSIASTDNWFIAQDNPTNRVFAFGYTGASKDLRLQIIGANSTGLDSYSFNTNEWYHCVLTFDTTTNAVIVYVNGQQVATGTQTNDIPSVTSDLYVGQREYASAEGRVNGKITNTKIFNEVLTAAQVADLYNNPEKVVPTGVDNTALKLWLPMMEGAGTTAYDGSGNGNHGTIAGATYVNGIGAPVAQSAVMDWNKGTNLLPHSAELDQFNNVIGVSVLTNQESISGNNDAFLISVNSSFGSHRIVEPLTTTSALHSVSFYAKANGVNKVMIFINGQNQGVIFNLDTATTQSFTKYNAVEATNQTIQDKGNGWYYCGFTLQIGTSATFQIQLYDAATTPDDAWIGDGTSGVYVYGVSFVTADNVKPYIPTFATNQPNDVLLPQGLTTGRDITGVNLFENVRKQGALNLDGNSWAEVHDNESLDITSAITLEAWVYWDDSSSNAILGKWDYSISKASYLIYKHSATNFRFFLSYNGTSVGLVTNSTSISNGWNHLAGVYDGVNIKCYLNGSEDGSLPYGLGIFETDLPVQIGKIESTTTPCPIAQPRIYNRALTASEVLRNYNSGKNTYTND